MSSQIAGTIASAVFCDIMFAHYPLTGVTLYVLSVITIIIGIACAIGE